MDTTTLNAVNRFTTKESKAVVVTFPSMVLIALLFFALGAFSRQGEVPPASAQPTTTVEEVGKAQGKK